MKVMARHRGEPIKEAQFEIVPELGDFPGDPHRDCVPTGRYCWRFRDDEGHVRATSAESFADAAEARQDIDDLGYQLGNLEAVGPMIVECPK